MKTEKGRKRILLNWFEMEGRPELLDPFIYDSQDLDFFHLYFYSREDRNVQLSPFHILYWFDYPSPYALLEKIKPDKIFLANGESLYEVALIIAANVLNIPVYCVQHGLIAPSFLDEVKEIKVDRSLKKIEYYFRVSRFYFSNLTKVSLKQSLELVRFYSDVLTKGQFYACFHNQFALRQPTGYVCYTVHNAGYFLQRDKTSLQKVMPIGVPFFDHFFLRKTADTENAEKYIVLIDTVITEGGVPVPEAYMNRYYAVINDYCKEKGCKLFIKLHPWAYKYQHLLKDENIIYYKAVEKEKLAGMIKEAQIVFSFFSTLLFPALFTNKRIVALDHPIHRFPQDLIGEGKLQSITLEENSRAQISEAFEYDVNFLKEVQEKYLYKTDGKAKERLKAIVSS